MLTLNMRITKELQLLEDFVPRVEVGRCRYFRSVSVSRPLLLDSIIIIILFANVKHRQTANAELQ